MSIDDDGVVVTPFLRTAYNYDLMAASNETAVDCSGDEILVQQQFREECDINTIVERFGLTGHLPINPQLPLDVDFVESMDYRGALEQLREAEEEFMRFPAEIRARFDNDPSKMVDFIADPKNIDQVRAWGFARPVEAPQAPIRVEVIPTPQPTVPTQKEPVSSVSPSGLRP